MAEHMNYIQGLVSSYISRFLFVCLKRVSRAAPEPGELLPIIIDNSRLDGSTVVKLNVKNAKYSHELL